MNIVCLLLIILLEATQVARSEPKSARELDWLPGRGEPPLTVETAYKKAFAALPKGTAVAAHRWVLETIQLKPATDTKDTRWRFYQFVFGKIGYAPRQRCTVTVSMDGATKVSPVKTEALREAIEVDPRYIP